MTKPESSKQNTLQERVSWLLSELPGSVPEIAKNLGVNRNTIFSYKKCKGDLKGVVLENLVKKYQVSSNWLLLGEGPVYKTKVSNFSNEKKIIQMDAAVQILHEVMEETGVNLNEKQQQACLKILREELEKSDSKAKDDLKKYITAIGE